MCDPGGNDSGTESFQRHPVTGLEQGRTRDLSPSPLSPKADPPRPWSPQQIIFQLHEEGLIPRSGVNTQT